MAVSLDKSDGALAARLAHEAGRLLLGLRSSSGLDGRALGSAADQAANIFLLAELRIHRPDDPVLSEESPDSGHRLGSERVWIIDPLDGTREYAEGRDDWAVHVALAVGGVPALGAVAVPAREALFRSDRPEALMRKPRRPIMLVSRTRRPPRATEIARAIGAELIGMGSAGAKAMAVVAGEADLYYHSGGQHEWDNCAPAAVALGAGLHASRLDGSPLVYNRPDTLLADLVIGVPALAKRVVELCA